MPGNAKRREERVKLVATAFSNLGVASIIAGFVSPVLTGKVHLPTAVGALLIGLLLHFVAQVILHYVVTTETPPNRREPQTTESEL